MLHELVERCVPYSLPLGVAAFEGGTNVAAVEHGASLSVDCSSKLALNSVRNDWRELGGDQRHSYNGKEQQRGRRRDAPENNFLAQPAIDATAAIDRLRSFVNRSGQLRVPDFKAREHGILGSAQAQHTIRR